MGQSENKSKKLLGGLLGVFVAVAVYLLSGGVGLTQQGGVCLAVLSFAIVWWIAGVLPDFATALLMAIGFMLLGGMDAGTVFSAFSTETWWLLVAAFGMGASMKRTGLMERMALAIIRKLPNSFAAYVAGLIAVGTCVGPFVPSMAAKVSMLAPIAMSMGDAAGYKRKGKQMQGLFMAMFTGVRTVAPAVISASVIGYALLGLLPQETQAQFGMLHWFMAALPWFALVTVLNLIALVCIYRPHEDAGDFIDAPADECHQAILEPGDAPTPMSLQEKELLAIVLCTVFLWATQPLHGLSAALVALVALVCMAACKILTAASFKSDINWTSLVFIGIVIGLAGTFKQAGVSDWLVSTTGPAFQALTANPYAFVIGVALLTLLLRFLIVSQIAYLNIVMAFLVPLVAVQGIDPWVAGFTMYAMIDPWFVLYQNPCYLAAYYSIDGQMCEQKDAAKYCLLYSAISVLGLIVSVPYWQGMGLL